MWAWASPLLSGHHHRIKIGDGSQGYGTEALRGRSELILFQVHSPHYWQWHLLPGKEQCWSTRSQSRHPLPQAWARAGMVTGHQSELQTTPDPFASVSHGRLHLFTCVLGPGQLHPVQETTLLNMSTSESCTRQKGLEQASGVGWVKRWGSCEPWAVSVGFLCLFQGVNTQAHTLPEWSLNFLQSSCESHWFSNSAKGIHLPDFEPRGGMPNTWFKPLTPQGGSLSRWHPPPLLCPLLGAQVPTWLLLLPSSANLCDLSSQAWV